MADRWRYRFRGLVHTSALRVTDPEVGDVVITRLRCADPVGWVTTTLVDDHAVVTCLRCATRP